MIIEKSPAQIQTMINQVRAKFLEEVNDNPKLYDPSDVDQIRNDDWQVERFILHKKTVDSAVEMLKNTYRWRKELNLAQLKDMDFPAEFFKIGAMFGLEKDINGNGVVYMRIRLHRKIKELDNLVKLFMVHIVNKVDNAMNGKGLTIVYDCFGSGVRNIDMEIAWFLVESLVKYYPYGMKNILIHEMPWIFSSVWTIVKGWMPEELCTKVKFTNKKNITEFIDKANLPYYLGGECKLNYHQVPKDCRTLSEMATEHNFNEKEVKKMLKMYQLFLDEADKMIPMLEDHLRVE